MNSNELIDCLLNENQFLRQLFESMNRITENLDLIKQKLLIITNECNCFANKENQILINELIDNCLHLKNNSKIDELKELCIFDTINDKLIELNNNFNNNSEIINNKNETKITINNYINSRKKLRKNKSKLIKIKEKLIEENVENKQLINENNIKVTKESLKCRRGRPRKEEWETIECHKRSQYTYSCSWPSCDKLFRFNSHLVNHFRRHTGEKPFRCDWVGCGKSFHTNAVLQNHQKTYHEKRNAIITTEKKPYKCVYPECEAKYFQRRDQLETHTSAVHTGQKPLRCDWPGCDFETVYKNKLKSHKWRHTGDKPFKCNWPSCEWTFRQSHHLKTHLLKHSGEKPFACDWPGCERRFQSKQALRIHSERTHCNQTLESIVRQ